MITERDKLLAQLATAVYRRIDENNVPVPTGWSVVQYEQDAYDFSGGFTGFSAGAFVSNSDPNEVIISFTGSNDLFDWVSNIVAGGGAGFLPTPQVFAALRFVSDVMAAKPNANITFTGHSLGGGLAGIMAVFFGRPATVFDTAPFENVARNPLSLTTLFLAYSGRQLREGRTINEQFRDYVASIGLGFSTGESLVKSISLSGEALDYIRNVNNTIAGVYEPAVDVDGSTIAMSLNPLRHSALHSLDLLSLAMRSEPFRQAADTYATLIEELGDPALYGGTGMGLRTAAVVDAVAQLHRFELGGRTLSGEQIVVTNAATRFAQDMLALGGVLQSATRMSALEQGIIATLIEHYRYTAGDQAVAAGELRQFVRSTAAPGAIRLDLSTLLTRTDSDAHRGTQRLVDGLMSLLSPEGRLAARGLASRARYWTIGNDGGSLVTSSAPSNDAEVQIGNPTVSNTLSGGDGDDLLVGGFLGDTLDGGADNDILLGGSGNDVLRGGTGIDQLIGDTGSDTLDGGGGSDILSGGAGFDTYMHSTGDGWDRIVGDDNDGHIVYDGQDLSNAISAQAFDPAKPAALTWTLKIGGQTYLAQLSSGDLSKVGTLSIWRGTDRSDRIDIEQFRNGDLGITLAAGPAIALLPADLGRNIWADPNYVPTPQSTTLLERQSQTLTVSFRGPAQAGQILRLSGPAGGLLQISTGGDPVNFNGTLDLQVPTGATSLTFVLISATDISAATDFTLNAAVLASDLTPVATSPALQVHLADFEESSPTTLTGDFGKGLDTDGVTYLLDAFGNYVANGDALAPRPDVIQGRDTANNISGGGGNDLLSGGGSDDVIDGGDGDDFIGGGAGRDTIRGGAGNDWIMGSGIGTIVGRPARTDATPPTIDYGTEFTRGLGWVTFGFEFGAEHWSGVIQDTVPNDAGNIIDGGAGDDQIFAGSGDDLVHGGADHDDVEGLAGDDTLFGDDGADYLWGDGANTLGAADYVSAAEHGDDTLDGGAGADRLVGQGGSDTLFGGTGNDILYGDSPLDSALYWESIPNSATGNDYLDGEAGNDWLEGGGKDDVLYGGDGDDILVGDTADAGHSASIRGNDILDGGAGNDQLFGGALSDTLLGGDGDDILHGDDAINKTAGVDQGDDYLDGGAGNDTLIGGGGSDILIGGAGNDFLFGDAADTPDIFQGNDSLDGGDGDDFLSGGGGADTLLGGAGNDTLEGDAGNDRLDGGAGNDTLRGGAGDDTLIGGAGVDFLDGGEGNDTYIIDAGDLLIVNNTVERIADTAGNNRLLIRSGLSATDFVLSQGSVAGRVLLSDQAGTLGIDIDGALSGSLQSVQFADGSVMTANKLIGQHYDAVVNQTTSNANAYLLGGMRDDTLSALAVGSLSTLSGGRGNDTLVGAAAGATNYMFELGDGADVISGDESTVDGQGVRQKNTIVFGVGITRESLTLSIASGAIALHYGTGTDQVTFSNLAANDVIDGRHVIDEIQLADNSKMTWAELVTASGFDITNTSNAPTLTGTNTDDYLFGGANAETIQAGAGDDVIDAGAGDDTVNGGTGNDSLVGGAGNDLLSGEDGTDLLFGDAGNDRLTGGKGNDTLRGAAGNDTYVLNIGDGQDQVIDNEGINTLQFGAGITAASLVIVTVPGTNDFIIQYGIDDSVIVGNGLLGVIDHYQFADGSIVTHTNMLALAARGALILTGDDAANTFDGGTGNDTINSLGGNDTLRGRVGNDVLSGGAGDDTYIYDIGDGADLINESSGTDSIAFGTGITSANVVAHRQAGTGGTLDLLLQIGAGADSIVIRDGLNAANPNAAIENIRFANGTVLTGTDIVRDLMVDALTLTGTPGVDVLQGGRANDSLDGGAGNDTLRGGAGTDTYRLTTGGGFDTVVENSGDASAITLGAGIALSNLMLRRQGDDLAVTLGATTDGLLLQNYFRAPGTWSVTDSAGASTTVGALLAQLATSQQNLSDDAKIAALRTEFRQAFQSYITAFSPTGNLNFDVFSELFVNGVLQRNVLHNQWGFGNVSINGDLTTLTLPTNLHDSNVPNSQTTTTENLPGLVFVQPPPTVTFVPVDQVLGPVTTVNNNPNRGIAIPSGYIPVYENVIDPNTGLPVRTLTGFTYSQAVPGRYVLQQNQQTRTLTQADNTLIRVIDIQDVRAGASNNTIVDGNLSFWGGRLIDAGAGDDVVTSTPGNSPYAATFAPLSANVGGLNARYTNDLGMSGAFLYGNADNDVLVGSLFRDELIGGTGDDFLNGAEQADLYTVLPGNQGWDVVFDTAGAPPGGGPRGPALPDPSTLPPDTVRFLAGITPASLRLSWGAVNVGTPHQTLDISWGSDSGIRVVTPGAADAAGVGIELFEFADGTRMTFAQLVALAPPRPSALATAPVLEAPLLAQSTNANTLFSYIIPAHTFLDRNVVSTLAYSVTLVGGAPLPSWLNFDATTRTLSGVPPGSSAGNLVFQVTATDSTNATTSTNLQLTVVNPNNPPVVAVPLADQVTADGSNFSFVVPATAFSDPNVGDTLALNATLADGSALPAWLSFNATSRTLSGTPGETDIGVVNVRIRATDSGGLSVTDDFLLTTTVAPDLALTGTPGVDVLVGRSGNDTLLGLASNDTLRGNSGNDLLDGGAGADTLIGGRGNDIYVVDDALDTAIENTNEGIDEVRASVSFTLSNNVENLTLTGTGAINATGNSLANALVGNAAANVLDGGIGADTLIGGAGNDIYIVDQTGDTVTENLNEGTDLVQSSITYALGANVENLLLTGTAAINGTGNALANQLTGNAGNNTLDGGAGADTMTGGAGDDVYIVDHLLDVVIENAGQGIDTIQSAVPFILPNNVENLTLTGSSVNAGSGNALDNVIVGNAAANALAGLAGNDTLDGGGDADLMAGGTGNDIYVVDNAGDLIIELANEGTDLVRSAVSHTLAPNVENLTLTGTAAINGSGNTLANVITGNGAANLLDGGTGADTLIGGAGNDTYVVDNALDVVTENANEGTDLVNAAVSFTLANNLENLTLTGTAAINGTGNALDNVLTGNSGNNTLTGLAGNDTLDGGSGGTDVLAGGLGNDMYVVNRATGITVIESANEGTDSVRASVTYTLGNNLENLTLTGVAAINGTGNTLNNALIGNSGVNNLSGLAGNDDLTGGAGNDTLTGGDGADRYFYAAGDGADTLNNSSTDTALDRLVFTNLLRTQLTFTRSVNDLVISRVGVASDTVRVTNWFTVTNNQIDFVETSGGIVTTAAEINALIAGGGSGFPNAAPPQAQIAAVSTPMADAIDVLFAPAVSKRAAVHRIPIKLSAASVEAMLDESLDTEPLPVSHSGLVNGARSMDRHIMPIRARPELLVDTPFQASWALTQTLTSQYLGASEAAKLGGDGADPYSLLGSLSNMALTPVIGALGSGLDATLPTMRQTSISAQDASPRLA